MKEWGFKFPNDRYKIFISGEYPSILVIEESSPLYKNPTCFHYFDPFFWFCIYELGFSFLTNINAKK